MFPRSTSNPNRTVRKKSTALVIVARPSRRRLRHNETENSPPSSSSSPSSLFVNVDDETEVEQTRDGWTPCYSHPATKVDNFFGDGRRRGPKFHVTRLSLSLFFEQLFIVPRFRVRRLHNKTQRRRRPTPTNTGTMFTIIATMVTMEERMRKKRKVLSFT